MRPVDGERGVHVDGGAVGRTPYSVSKRWARPPERRVRAPDWSPCKAPDPLTTTRTGRDPRIRSEGLVAVTGIDERTESGLRDVHCHGGTGGRAHAPASRIRPPVTPSSSLPFGARNMTPERARSCGGARVRRGRGCQGDVAVLDARLGGGSCRASSTARRGSGALAGDSASKSSTPLLGGSGGGNAVLISVISVRGAFVLGEATPDALRAGIVEGEREAVEADRTARADRTGSIDRAGPWGRDGTTRGRSHGTRRRRGGSFDTLLLKRVGRTRTRGQRHPRRRDGP